MGKGHKIQGFVDGYLRNFRIVSPVDEAAIKRLLQLSASPYGGVYVIHHPPTDLEGRDFFREFKDRNPGMKAYVGYTTFETDRIPEPWVESCNQMDEVWVPSHFNIETFSGAGVIKEKLHVIPHGFDPNYYRPETTEPMEIGERKGFNFLSIFEWTYRKGWDVLIRAYLEEFESREDVRLILRTYQGGGVVGTDAPPLVTQLSEYIVGLGHDPETIPDILIMDKIVPADLMPALYKSADVFILPTRGEGWGIPLTESMLMEVPVIATRWSAQQEFMNDENSYPVNIDGIVPVREEQVRDNHLYAGHSWAEPSVAHTRHLMRHVFENREEVRTKGRLARKHILNNFSIHHAGVKIADRLLALDRERRTCMKKRSGKKSIKVLFQARPNIFSLPGGDTDVMLKLKNLFEDSGITVDFSSNTVSECSEYDLIHIFNFETQFALNAVMKQKPFVVTPMYEDINKYYSKSFKAVNFFRRYIENADEEELEKGLAHLAREQISQAVPDFNFIAGNADTVLVSGESEGQRIRSNFPEVRNIHTVRLGFTRQEDFQSVSEDMFINEYGVRDFVLCVGRLETRKNQLMLLYALKDEDLPVVFVNSGTIQPDYEDLCRKFRRKGKTIYTGRVSREMLFSAYRAARVHALPSWYELPGIVSLEAGWFDCNVVASEWGTIREYLGNHAFYCKPDNPESIRKAVLSAMNRPYDKSLHKVIDRYSWESEANTIINIYREVLSSSRTHASIKARKKRVEQAKKEMIYQQLREKAYNLTQKNPQETIDITEELVRHRTNDPNIYYIAGTASLFLMKYGEAADNLGKAVKCQPFIDIKAYLYLTLALFKLGKFESALGNLEESLCNHPFSTNETRALVHEYMMKAYAGLGDEIKAAEMKSMAEHIKNREEPVGVD